MSISIYKDCVLIEVKDGVIWVDCKEDIEQILTQLKNCIRRGDFDRLDYQCITMFVLQNRRTIGVC